MGIESYNRSASLNTTLGSISVAEGMERGNVSDAIRQLMADIASGVVPSVSVKQFGALGNGVANDTAACQAALNSGAKAVRFPAGRYRVSGLTVPTEVTVFGDGYGSTVSAIDNVSTVFDVGIDCVIRDLHITADAQRTGGIYLDADSGLYVGNCKFSSGFNCINIGAASSIVTVDQCNFRVNNNNNTSDVIIVDTTGADISITECVFDNTAATMPRSGIRVRAVSDLTVTNCNIIHCGTDMLIDPPTGKVVASVWCNGVFFDTATKGVDINPNAGGSVVRCHFMNCWAGSNTGVGIDINGASGTIDGVHLTDFQANLNGSDGIRLAGAGAINIRINGGQAAQNAGAGFSAGATSTKFSVRNFTSGACDGLTGNLFGLYVNAGASNFDVSDNFCSGNTSSDTFGLIPSLASAATVAIPAAGRTFIITGATGISGLSGGNVGRRITLLFASNPIITHGTASTSAIRLSGAVNFTPTAGGALTLEHDGSYWREIGRSA